MFVICYIIFFSFIFFLISLQKLHVKVDINDCSMSKDLSQLKFEKFNLYYKIDLNLKL